MKAVVIGGGLAGLSAALELVDAGHDVALLEARPTLGGKVQTLPEREGDPEPPPDNGQHIALGCFTEYLKFLQRIGSRDDVRRLPLELTVIDERGRAAKISYGLGPLLRYRHLPLRDRVRIAVLLARLPRLVPREAETFGEFLKRHGQTATAIERFWDVFIRPGLNLRTDEVDAGSFAPCEPAAPRATSSCRRRRSGRCMAMPPAARSKRRARACTPARAWTISPSSTPTR
jgi:protoporphyrinogen oxidase